MNEKLKIGILSFLALLSGIFIAVIDSNPSWDDTGITAFMIFVTTAIMGFISPKMFWMWALLIGIWIPVYGFFWTGNKESILALIIGFIGAYSGALSYKIIKKF